jgi:DNA-binding XRE family transcriptional regulator
MGRNLNDIIAELPPTRRARIDAQYKKLKQDVESLRELRRIAGKAQADIATALKIKQPSVSKIEKQADMYLSTLRGYVEAIGGELELVVMLPGRPVLRLQHLGEAFGHTLRPAKPNVQPRRRIAASRKAGSVSVLKRS